MNDPVCTELWCVFLLISALIISGILLGQFFDILYDTWDDWRKKK